MIRVIDVKTTGLEPPDAEICEIAAVDDGGGSPWIDTYKVATRLWPDAPNHKNQTLRYWLGVDLDREMASPPHRAGPDAYVTAHILVRALGLISATEMARISAQPALLPKLQFGKHFGTKFADAPDDYLHWLSRQEGMDEDVVFTARHEISRRQEIAA